MHKHAYTWNAWRTLMSEDLFNNSEIQNKQPYQNKGLHRIPRKYVILIHTCINANLYRDWKLNNTCSGLYAKSRLATSKKTGWVGYKLEYPQKSAGGFVSLMCLTMMTTSEDLFNAKVMLIPGDLVHWAAEYMTCRLSLHWNNNHNNTKGFPHITTGWFIRNSYTTDLRFLLTLCTIERHCLW